MPGYWTTHPMLYNKNEWMYDPIMQTGDVEAVSRNITKNFDELLAKYGYHRSGNYYRVEQSNTDIIVIFCHLGTELAILSIC